MRTSGFTSVPGYTLGFELQFAVSKHHMVFVIMLSHFQNSEEEAVRLGVYASRHCHLLYSNIFEHFHESMSEFEMTLEPEGCVMLWGAIIT